MRFFVFFVLAVYGLSRFQHSDFSFESKLRKAIICFKYKKENFRPFAIVAFAVNFLRFCGFLIKAQKGLARIDKTCKRA